MSAVIREVMSIVGCKYQVAKNIVKLSAQPIGEVRKIGPNRKGAKKPMHQHEAKAVVDAARERIALVDEGD